MSFAQFEREVTAERIRDKVAASKRKGLWMGGRVPLGYEKDERTLRINEAEAETVRTLYAVLSKNTNELKTGAPGRRRVSSIIMMESATIKGLATRLCFWTRRPRRFTGRQRTASCCRRATLSRASSRRALKAEMRARTNGEIKQVWCRQTGD